MNKPTLKFNNEKIYHIIAELELANALENSLHKKNSAIEVINQLLENNLSDAAILFLALGLPKREAAWWGLLVAQAVENQNSDLHVQHSLRICEQWVRNPSDELRHQAKLLAEILDLATTSSWVAMGIFWSGDNIAAINKQPVVPAEFMSGRAIANSIHMAINFKSGNRQETTNYFLRQGIHIMMGGNGKI